MQEALQLTSKVHGTDEGQKPLKTKKNTKEELLVPSATAVNAFQ